MVPNRVRLQKANVNPIPRRINTRGQILDCSANCSANLVCCIQDVKDAPWIHSLFPLICSAFIASWPLNRTRVSSQSHRKYSTRNNP